ncbi:MAG: carbohydrate ABC transporter permease [Bifidobacteriaceae bacterium]|jgi:ABC-type glycerol-3-phosphate transport system permease component|nr:carbohydrate ABC transporter permease [Bifidobacteriaceae bacterium]
MKPTVSLPRRLSWFGIMAIAALISLGPVIWTLSTSLKSQIETQQFPPTLIPSDIRPSNYSQLFSSAEFMAAASTSAIVTIAVTVLVLLIAFPCAYGLVRLRAFGSRILLLLVALAQTVPAIVFLIPIYWMASNVGLYDTQTILVVVYTGLLVPFSTLILAAFLRGIPIEAEEAALVDGCSHFGVLRRIVLPMSRPALATAALFTALYSWNEFLVAAVLGGDRARPLTVYISHFVTQKTIEWGPMCAAVSVVLLPVLIAVIALQRHLVTGLTMGAVKG